MKFITNTICSSKQVKSLLEIADEMDKAEQVKLASANKQSTVKTATAKAPVAVQKTAKVKETVKVKETKVATKVEKSEPAKTEVTAKAEKPTFVKIAKLDDKDRGYLNKYFRKYYPADYVDALLASY